jgi:pimeloyl-ACP methyl ester carboxylesterase
MNPMTFRSNLGDLAYWQTRSAEPSAPTLVFLHGWPFNARTFRKLHPLLATDFNCVLVDWPGLGESVVDASHARKINFLTMADVLADFLAHIEADRVSVIAHDTGATIARLALSQGASKVDRLICLSTELPGHHLPLIPRLKRLFSVPMMPQLYTLLLRSTAFINSPSGFSNCVADIRHLDADFIDSFITPIIEDRRKLNGLIAYLNGIDWSVVDDLHAVQSRIAQPVAMIWGSKDKIFPIELARASAASFGGGSVFVEISEAGFLAVEERPNLVAEAIRSFLKDN